MSLPVWARDASNRCLSRPAPLGASAKDQLENKLHAQVCSGAMALPDAQQAMATDWYAAWQHYLGATPTPTRTPAPPPAVVGTGTGTGRRQCLLRELRGGSGGWRRPLAPW